MEFYKRLDSLCKATGTSVTALLKSLNISTSKGTAWKNGSIPRADVLQKLATALHTTPAYLMGWEVTSKPTEVPPGFMPLPETCKVPLVGRIACGQPITAEENIEDYLDVPVGHHVDFALLCEGDSMVDAGIDDGDVVYIRKQPDVENGQIAAVRIDNEATLKRVYKYVDRIVLQPENRAYPPLTYVGAEMNQVTIEGKAVGWLHWV